MSRPRPLLVALAVLLVVVAACTTPDPDATVVRRTGSPASEPGPSADATRPQEAPASPGGDAGARDPVGPADPAAHATLTTWSACEDGFECATLTVPRRWSDVDGETLDLAVVRHRAEGQRIGSLVLNPGGPGASGVDFVRAFVGGSLPDGLDERFDVVGWDPRGTGRSERIDCTSDEEWLEAEVDPTPDDQADIDAIRAESEDAASTCIAEVGDLLELVGTRATVRDLEALRGALGDEGLSYVGYSYGTTIGMEYLRLFPDRVRAMVLDGVAVPGAEPIEDSLVQARGFERALDAYLAGCADRPSCTLGDDPKAAMLDLVDRLEAGPISADYSYELDGAQPRPGSLGVGELYIAVASALYTEASWPTLDQGLASARAATPDGRTLLALRDEYLGRQPDGTWEDDADARGAIRCADQAARSTQPEGDTDLVAPWSSELPFWGAWFAVGLPGCWGLPEAIEPLAPLTDGALTGAPPVVVIGTTNDPATPYEQSEQAERIIDGSVLVTFVGDQHTVYSSQSDCIDDPVTAYLITLEPPAPGLRCEG